MLNLNLVEQVSANLAYDCKYFYSDKPCHYHKQFLATHAQNWFSFGERGCPVVDTDLGRIGLLICFDGRIPEIFRGVKVWQIRRRDLGHVHRTEYGDGTGDVVLQEFFVQYSEKWGKSETQWNRIGFLAIPDVKTVEALVRKTLMTVSDSTGPND